MCSIKLTCNTSANEHTHTHTHTHREYCTKKWISDIS